MELATAEFVFLYAPLAGIFHGFFVAILLGGLHIWQVEKSPYSFTNNKLSVLRTNTIQLDMSVKEAFEICEEYCVKENLSTEQRNPDTGILKAKQGLSWKAWGYIINFEINESEHGNAEVKISSRPRLKWTLADYGKSLENVGKATEFLQKSSDSNLGYV